MAVIKIVPMPGAKGDKGDDGATGAQGLQGPIGETGPAGADAAWYYNGAYNPGASYVVGDVVTYDGQTWYRKNANGGNVGDTPSVGPFWDLVAAKGADGEVLQTQSISGTWDCKFFEISGITINPNSPATSLYPPIATYYTVGDLVFFHVHILTFDALAWGDPFGTNPQTGLPYQRQMAFELPFNVKADGQTNGAFPNAPWNVGLTQETFVGRGTFRNDTEPYYAVDPNTYQIVEPYGPDEFATIPLYGRVAYNATAQKHTVLLNAVDDSDINNNTDTLAPITQLWPVDYTQGNSNPTLQKYLRFDISGVYRAELDDVYINVDQYIQGPQGIQGIQGPQGEPGPAGSFVYKSGAVPATHHGVAGDTKNDIKYDDTHMYICVADYTDGSAAIWKRINWASGNW